MSTGAIQKGHSDQVVFISFSGQNRGWGDWIASTLNEAGVTIIYQPWHFAEHRSFVSEMDRALLGRGRVLAVLSPQYLASPHCRAEWEAAYQADPDGNLARLSTVRVSHCEIKGILGRYPYRDLFGISEEEARERLLQAIGRGSLKPKVKPPFLGGALSISRAVFAFALPSTHRSNPYFVPSPSAETALLQMRPGDVLVLHGLGGIGKTQHAVQYAHAQYDEGRGRHVLWVSAESEQGLRETLAALVDLPELSLTVPRTLDTIEKCRIVCDWLSSTENWILILDNADTVEVARLIERLLPSRNRGKVVITARIAEWTPAFRVQSVELWTEVQAGAFLANRLSGPSVAAEELGDLTKALGYLPLALEQAAAYIQHTRASVREYLQLFAEDRRHLLTRGFAGMTDYSASVATTWHVSIQRLNFLSRYLLHISACLAADPIPRRIFTKESLGVAEFYNHGARELRCLRQSLSEPDAINLSFGELATYSLVWLSEFSFRVHPLLQAIIRDSWRFESTAGPHRILRKLLGIAKEEAMNGFWPQRAADLLSHGSVLPDAWSNTAAFFEMREYVPHLDAVLDLLPAKIFESYISRGALAGILKNYYSRANAYSAGVAALRDVFLPAAEHSPNLKVELEWLLERFKELYCHLPEEGGIAQNASFYLTSIGKGDLSRPRLELAYDVIRLLSEGQAKVGEFAMARRLYRFWFDHASLAPEAPLLERAEARVEEAIFLARFVEKQEMRQLLEEGLTFFDQCQCFNHADALNGVWNYAEVVDTPEELAKATNWLRQAIGPARTYLEYGMAHACQLTTQLVAIMKQSGAMKDGLRELEATLRLAIRSPKLKKKHLVQLWVTRGELLKELGDFVHGGRSYLRALHVERRHGTPTALRQGALLNDAGEMFRRGGYSRAAACLLQAATFITRGWPEAPEYAEILAALTGLALTRTGQRQPGETLLRRAIESRNVRVSGDLSLVVLERLYCIYLVEAERWEEAVAELLRTLKVVNDHRPEDDHKLRSSLESLVSLLDDFGWQEAAEPLRRRLLALEPKTQRTEE